MEQVLTTKTSLETLISLWDIKESYLKQILKVFNNSINESNQYIGFMNLGSYKTPKSAWKDWCAMGYIGLNCDNNPFK